MSAHEGGGFVRGSSQLAWPDAPWRITGRTLTAWFPVPDGVLRAVVPGYLRSPAEKSWGRLRFYDARFESLDQRPQHPLVPRSGAFREAVVAFSANGAGLEGDSTMFMWADDDVYRTWGREIYGWPILTGTIDLEGSLWQPSLDLSATGSARLHCAAGEAAMVEVVVSGVAEQSPTRPLWWLTPRRRFDGRRLPSDNEEIVAVRPDIAHPGVAYAGQGVVQLDFVAGHPLHGLSVEVDRVVVVDGFELVVPGQIVVSPSAS